MFAGLCYTTAQFKGLGDTVEVVTHGEWSKSTSRWLLMVFMYSCEVIGSMSSVMMSDFVQSSIMIFAIGAFTLTLMSHYGTISDIGPWNCKEAPNCVALKGAGLGYNNPGNGPANFFEQTGKLESAEKNIYFNVGSSKEAGMAISASIALLFGQSKHCFSSWHDA